MNQRQGQKTPFQETKLTNSYALHSILNLNPPHGSNTPCPPRDQLKWYRSYSNNPRSLVLSWAQKSPHRAEYHIRMPSIRSPKWQRPCAAANMAGADPETPSMLRRRPVCRKAARDRFPPRTESCATSVVNFPCAFAAARPASSPKPPSLSFSAAADGLPLSWFATPEGQERRHIR